MKENILMVMVIFDCIVGSDWGGVSGSWVDEVVKDR